MTKQIMNDASCNFKLYFSTGEYCSYKANMSSTSRQIGVDPISRYVPIRYCTSKSIRVQVIRIERFAPLYKSLYGAENPSVIHNRNQISR